jgi:hypothetical protein
MSTLHVRERNIHGPFWCASCVFDRDEALGSDWGYVSLTDHWYAVNIVSSLELYLCALGGLER